MASQVGLDGGRQHRDPVLVSFAAPDHELVGLEIHVLRPETRAFEHSKSGAIHQERHQPWNAAQSLDDGSDLVSGQDDRKPRRSLSSDEIVEPREILVEDLAIEEE